MQNSKKPLPLMATPPREACPVCHKPTYSVGGVHPQCAVARENAQEQAIRRAALPPPAPRPEPAWMKACKSCGKMIHSRRMSCDCGYVFIAVAEQNSKPKVSGFVQYSRETHPLVDKEQPVRPTPISDSALAQQVNQKLAARGIRSPCKVQVGVAHGDVTLNGSVQHAHQKSAAVQTASSMSGVRRVIDQLTVKPHVKR